MLLLRKAKDGKVKKAASELINAKHTWDEASKTCQLKSEKDPDGVTVEIKF